MTDLANRLEYICLLQKRIKQLEADNDVLNESISEYDKAVNALQNQIEQLEADIEEYKDVIDSYKQKLDVSECLYEDSQKRIKQLEADLAMVRKHLDQMLGSCDECKVAEVAENQKLREAINQIATADILVPRWIRELAQKALKGK